MVMGSIAPCSWQVRPVLPYGFVRLRKGIGGIEGGLGRLNPWIPSNPTQSSSIPTEHGKPSLPILLFLSRARGLSLFRVKIPSVPLQRGLTEQILLLSILIVFMIL